MSGDTAQTRSAPELSLPQESDVDLWSGRVAWMIDVASGGGGFGLLACILPNGIRRGLVSLDVGIGDVVGGRGMRGRRRGLCG